jgi:hypothetical protein
LPIEAGLCLVEVNDKLTARPDAAVHTCPPLLLAPSRLFNLEPRKVPVGAALVDLDAGNKEPPDPVAR